MAELGTSGEVIVAAREAGRAALFGYLPVGFPDVSTTRRAAEVMAERVDLIILGHPTTDASHDGSKVTRALQQACSHGVDNEGFLETMEACVGKVPVIAFAYWNEVLRLGPANFCREIRNAGGAGVAAPDLTADHAAKWIETTDRFALDRIFTAHADKPDEKLALVAQQARGFVYVPGIGEGVDGDIAAETSRRLRAADPDVLLATDSIGLPTAGAANAATIADAVIAGTTVVEVLPHAPGGDLTPLAERLDELAAGLAH